MSPDLVLPRYVLRKPLVGGRAGFYWTCPSAYRKAGFPIKAKPLGTDLEQKELDEAAFPVNAMLDEWRSGRCQEHTTRALEEFGTVAWLFRTYQRDDCFLQRVDPPNRSDYERVFHRLAQIPMKGGRTLGETPLQAVTVKTAVGVYGKLANTGALRSAEKALTYAATAWRRMLPLYPSAFPAQQNPWEGVTKRRREKLVKPAVTREEVYRFAEGAIALGRPQCAAAAVLCFEWLMRPRNVAAGLATWADYRGHSDDAGIRIRHKKNRQTRIHPLEFVGDVNGGPVLLYAEAEAVLARVPRWGLSIVSKPNGTAYGETTTRLAQITADTAAKLGLLGFTLDACRHGGLTELEEAALTDGQGRALSGHLTRGTYAGYAKETRERMLVATLQRRRPGNREGANEHG